MRSSAKLADRVVDEAARAAHIHEAGRRHLRVLPDSVQGSSQGTRPAGQTHDGRRVELSVEYAQVQGSQAGGCEWKGYLKGYVSYSMKTLVVSKVLAFPPVKDVTKWIVWNETRWSEGIVCINQFEVSTIE